MNKILLLETKLALLEDTKVDAMIQDLKHDPTLAQKFKKFDIYLKSNKVNPDDYIPVKPLLNPNKEQMVKLYNLAMEYEEDYTYASGRNLGSKLGSYGLGLGLAGGVLYAGHGANKDEPDAKLKKKTMWRVNKYAVLSGITGMIVGGSLGHSIGGSIAKLTHGKLDVRLEKLGGRSVYICKNILTRSRQPMIFLPYIETNSTSDGTYDLRLIGYNINKIY